LELALHGQLQELVVTYKDRLTRFGFELIQSIITFHKGKIMVLNREEEQTPEQELCQDIIAITTVFTARIHGFRSGRNKAKKHGAKGSEEREE
jgi:predicted site-specific integrase-resolvase